LLKTRKTNPPPPGRKTAFFRVLKTTVKMVDRKRRVSVRDVFTSDPIDAQEL
jgi:hypothetical protein